MQFSESTALVTDKLDWKQYLKPKDLTDLEDCRRIDEFNQGIWEYNNSNLPRINELLEKMGIAKYKLDAPPKYYLQAKRNYDKKIREPDVRMLLSIKYLAARGKYAMRDYELEAGPKLADDIAEQEFIESAHTPVDITMAAGMNHRENCTCDNKWDGKSARCLGTSVRVRWVRQATHHFLQPDVKPEVF